MVHAGKVRGGIWSGGALLEVRPGETARAELGGKGRPVLARIAMPPGFDPKRFYAANSQFEIVSDRPEIPFPKELQGTKDGAMDDWLRRWWASKEGRDYRRGFIRLHGARLPKDGTIRLEDVPPGAYRLDLMYSADPIRRGPLRGGADRPRDEAIHHPRDPQRPERRAI